MIDNALSHPSDMQLMCGDIKAICLLPNVISLLQPIDHDALQNINKLCELELQKITILFSSYS